MEQNNLNNKHISLEQNVTYEYEDLKIQVTRIFDDNGKSLLELLEFALINYTK